LDIRSNLNLNRFLVALNSDCLSKRFNSESKVCASQILSIFDDTEDERKEKQHSSSPCRMNCAHT